jgi:hypothetical protein
VGFWAVELVVIPLIVLRNHERTAGVVAATVGLLGYVLLMQDAIR